MAKTNEDWMNRKWRPTMAWMYMAICIADFLVFPILWAVIKAQYGQNIEPWDPLTLKGAGLFHMAMGAVLGITAWTRGREKLAAYNNSYTTPDYIESNYYEQEHRKPVRKVIIRNGRKAPSIDEDELL